MEKPEGPLTGRAQLIVDATRKYIDGERMMLEGAQELESLLGLKSGAKKGSREGVPKYSNPLLMQQKVNKPLKDPSTFRKETRTDEDLKKLILVLLSGDELVTTNTIRRKYLISERRIERLLVALGDQVEQKSDGQRKFWVLTKKAQKQLKKKHKKTFKRATRRVGKVSKSGRHQITPEEFGPKILAYLNSTDWVSKGMLIRNVGISEQPLNRVLNHLQKEGQVRVVMKKNNPAHDKKNTRKFFVREMPYWEAV